MRSCAWLLACALSIPLARGLDAQAPAGAPAEDDLLERARHLYAEARAAEKRRDLELARERAGEAIDALLADEVTAGAAGLEARTAVLFDLGWCAFESGDLHAAQRAWERVLEARLATLPADDAGLQEVRQNLAVTRNRLGDLQGARELQEAVLEVRARTLPADHRDLQFARLNLALTLKSIGDVSAALALEEDASEVLARTLPAGHPDLQRAQLALATSLFMTGDLEGALDLQQQVLEARSSELPPDHREVQTARLNLAMTLIALGDAERARGLQEQALEVFSRTLPAEHPDLQAARQGLANSLQALGDLSGARALQEQVLEVRARTLPADHTALQGIRLNLAATLYLIGDLAGARALQEQVLEVLSRTMPADDVELQKARVSLATTLLAQGEPAAARALLERVLEVFSATLPPEHPFVQLVRGNLSATLHQLGLIAESRALDEQVLEAMSLTLPADHPDLQRARVNLATALLSSNDPAGAQALMEDVLEVLSGSLPADHPDLQVARGNLATMVAARCAVETRGRGPGPERDRARETCAELLLAMARGHTRAAREALLSAPAREAEERCAHLTPWLDRLLSFARGCRVFEPTPALEIAAFELSETTRAAPLAAAAIARTAVGAPGYAEARATLVRASAELVDVARRSGTTGADFDRARVEREDAEGALLALARRASGGSLAGLDPDPASLSAALGDRTAAVSFRRFEDGHIEVQDAPDGEAELHFFTDERLCAFVVRGSTGAGSAADPVLVDLGEIEPVEAAVRAWRAAIDAGGERGLGAVVAAGAGPDPMPAGAALRQLVLDPLLPAVGDAQRIVLALDDVLHLVAFDALPLDERGDLLVGDRWRIETRSTLGELLSSEVDVRSGDPGILLAVGGIDYEGRTAEAIAASSSPGGRERPIEVAAALRGGSWSEGFAPLAATLVEVEGIDAAFRQSFGADAERTLLTGGAATKAALFEHAPQARFLHVATHGWFASESIRSWSDPRPIDTQSGLCLRQSGGEQVRGMSPMLLCGLALAGANLPEDALGRVPGLVTAEELAALDLSRCELAVLSACDTNAGERRAGQGVASLQRALQMAGARSAITSLWRVPDEATKELMLDLYRRIWIERQDKAEALWQAKQRLRVARDEDGRPKYGVRDWAAWVLTGDPR